jgi:hypothetical protein
MVASQQPVTRNRDEVGIQIARDCDVVQPPPQLPRQSVPPIRIASTPRWRPARRRISRAPSYRGHHMANPETSNAPVGGGAFASVRQQYRMRASCSPIQMDVKPVGADSRYRIHTHCSSPQRGHVWQAVQPVAELLVIGKPISSEPASRRVWAHSGRARRRTT